jgi:hypothetical protein
VTERTLATRPPGDPAADLVRLAHADALEKTGAPERAHEVYDALEHSPDETVRAEAAERLGEKRGGR